MRVRGEGNALGQLDDGVVVVICGRVILRMVHDPKNLETSHGSNLFINCINASAQRTIGSRYTK